MTDPELFVTSFDDDQAYDEETPRRRYKSRNKKRKKRRRITVGRVIAALVILFTLTYFSMVVYTSNFTMLETEQADFYELNDSVEVEATALRSEEYITNTKKGIISYTVEDGEKVNAGGTVAKLFASEQDVESFSEYNEIESELNVLNQMTDDADNLFVNLETVDAQIKKKLIDYRTMTVQNKLPSAAASKLDLLRLFNERTVVTGGSANFDGRIAELQAQLDSISVPGDLGSVKSKNSGFFVSLLDGYENALDYTKAESLTADELNAVVRKDPPSDAVGKIIKTINWYMLCPVSSEQALTVASGNTVVEVSVPRVMSGTIPATVISVNQSSKVENGLLVLKCDYMDGTLANIRRENITIKTYTYSGLRVSRSAIHDDYVTVRDKDENGEPIGEPYKKKAQGVYVVYGKRLAFVPVHIIYSDNDFVICSDDVNDPELPTGETIALHDTIVVRGKELYDGKIVR